MQACTDGWTDELIRVELGNLRFLQVNTNIKNCPPMTKDTPSSPSPDTPPIRSIERDSLDVAFDLMLLDLSSIAPSNFTNEWGASDTEEALAVFSGDDARIMTLLLAQPEVCYCSLHPHRPKLLVAIHRTEVGRHTYYARSG